MLQGDSDNASKSACEGGESECATCVLFQPVIRKNPMHHSSPNPAEQHVLEHPPLATLARRGISQPAVSAEGAYSSTVRNREFANHLCPFSPRQPAIGYVAEHLINQKHAKMTARDARSKRRRLLSKYQSECYNLVLSRQQNSGLAKK